MDHHRQFHHQNHHHHHPPRQFINSPPHPSSSRYLPLRPPPPPHPPFPEDHHRNIFSHPQRHLPPPPQHHHHHHPLPPPCVLHRPPPPHPPPHQNITNFAPSPPHHHHLHQHHRDEVRRSPPRVIFPPNFHHTHNHNINHDSYYRVVDEIGHRSRFPLNELPPPNSRVSPPKFHSSERFRREIDTVPRFREDLNHEPHVRVQLHHPQEEIEFRPLRRTDRIDDCIDLKSVDRFEEDFDRDRNRDHRSLGVVDRLEGDFDRGYKNLGVPERLEGDFSRRNLGVVERLEGDFDHDRRKLGVIDRLEDRGRDYDHHERYHPEMVAREAYDLNSVNNECFRGGLVNGDAFIRGGRDDVMEENVKRRRSSGSREVSRSPIKFRGGGMEVDDDFSDRLRKEDINECNSHGTPRKTVQKKSAFLRIQPAKQQHPSHQHSGYRNRTDNTTSSSSSQKGKESSSECLDSRVSEERVGSPVELDVSFKSNALVAKAITAASSCSDAGLDVDNALSDSGIRLDGESPSRVVRFKINSSMSKKGGKDSKNRLRVSPMKRLGDLNDGQVRDNRSESSPSVSGSSKSDKASPNSEDLMKDKNIADFEKVSSPPVRKKRKAISPLSRLSSVASSKADSVLVNLESLANHPSDDSMSYDTPGKKPENKSSCAGNDTGSTQNEYVDMGKIDLNESYTVVDLVSQSAAERREKKILDSLPDCSGSLGPADSEGHGNTELSLQSEQNILNPDGEITKPVEKFSSDILTDNHGVESQGKALVNHGFVEGSSKSMAACAVNHMENNDIRCENADTLDSVAIMSSTMNPVNILNKNKNDVDLTCPVVDSKKGRRSSPEVATVGLSLAIDNEPSLGQTVAYGKVGSALTDISNEKRRASLSDDDDGGGGGGAFSSKNVNSSDVQGTDESQEQQSQGSETTSYNDRPILVRDESPKTCARTGDSSSVLNRKREAGTEPDSSYLSMSESCHESALSISSCIENAMLSVEKFISEVSGLPCVESDVSHGNEFTESCVKKMKTVDSVCDLDPIEHISRRGKKRKTFTMGSNMYAAPGSQSSEFIPLAEGSSVECSQLVEGFKLPKSAIVEKELDRATRSSCAMLCSSPNSKSDSMYKDTSLSIVESAPPDGKQYPLSEHGCNQNIDEKLVMAGGNDHIGFKLLESECTTTANVAGGNFQCLPADLTGDEDQGTLTVDMECDDTIAQNAHMCSVSGSQSCAGSINGRVTMNSDMLNMPSSASLPDPSHISPAVGVSNVSLEVQSCSDEKPTMDDKKSNQPLTTRRRSSSTSKINLLAESQNLKPGISATSGIQSNTQKSASLLSKQVKTAPSLNMNRARRNVLTRSEANVSASHHSTVINPSNRTQAYPTKTRTWHRANNLVAVDTVKKPSIATTLPQRPLCGKALKGQDTSYIRKGNSLVRNPASSASGVATSDSRTLGASMDRSKPNVTDQIRKEDDSSNIEPSEVLDKCVTGVRSASTEMPKLPPSIGSGKASHSDIAHSVECMPSISVHQSEGTDSQLVLKFPDTSLESARDPESIVNRNLEDPGMFSDGDVRGSNSKRLIYIKHKSNQLIAASKNSNLSLHSMDRKVASSSDINYFKRRKNQLIRASSEGNIHQMLAVVEDSSNSQSQSAFQAYPGRSLTKKLSNKGKSSKRSLVWTLGDSKSCGKGMDVWKSGRLLSHLLPWKRATYWSRKLLSSRKRSVLYVKSGRGFSLRRSKVISLPGKSLKWSKSMEKRSKRAEKEAAVAVARDTVEKSGPSGISNAKKPVNGLKLYSGERIFRIGVFRYRMDPSRRTLQRISDAEVDISASTTQKDARKTYVPKRLLIGSDEYIRIGNGNQLVRDPKRRTRILASEKVRWSLHTARMRSAKKRKFCQFFTRFGKCNKGEGKCPFIHDPSKIAVCTKFLNGLCADPSCQLTHKVIPERMPDCSFFLQGLCSNEKCPYRHVNVNPKASICESFLRGYCAEGNECRKKHSYICPEFEASGSCPQGSKCKLYHPKKGKAKKRKVQRDQKNSKGRYFGSALSMVVDPETRPLLEKHVETNKDELSFDGDMGDFISLDVSDDDDEVQENVGSQQISVSGEDDIMSLQLDDNDDLIKPFRILGRA